MTIVEVMVAGLILVIGSLGLLGLVDTASRSTYRAEQSQVVSDRLQQEMEQIKGLPFEEIALTGIPTDTSNTKLPNWRVVGTSFATGQDGGQVQPLVFNGGTLYEGGTISDGAVSAAPEAFDSGDVRGTIHRFVTWEDDPSCPAAQCPGSQDLKRVVVSLLLDTSPTGGQRVYQELQAQIANPESEPVDNENPVEGEEDATPWTFWFTDTSCNNAIRQPIVADHLTHNTRGVCGTGVTNGNNPGAPDLLYTRAAEFDPEAPIFDYATDVEPTQNPGSDRGLQLVRGTSSGCPATALDIMTAPDGAGEPDVFQKIHKWLSPPVPGGYNVTLNGEGTLNLWSQTVNEAVHSGKLCIWLFVRRVNAQSQLVDTPAVNQNPPLTGQTYFTVEKTQWPTTWTEVQIPLDFTLSTTLSPGSQLGVAFAVDQGGTGGGGLQFMYDEPSFDSRLELKSDSLLPTF